MRKLSLTDEELEHVLLPILEVAKSALKDDAKAMRDLGHPRLEASFVDFATRVQQLQDRIEVHLDDAHA